MTLPEVYVYFGCRWAAIARAAGIAESTVYYWKRIGYIPHSSQKLLEAITNGDLKADEPTLVVCGECGNKYNLTKRKRMNERAKQKQRQQAGA